MTESSRFSKKFVEHIFKLLKKKDEDEAFYGNSFVEFTDRKIEIVCPLNVSIVTDKKGKTKGWINKVA